MFFLEQCNLAAARSSKSKEINFGPQMKDTLKWLPEQALRNMKSLLISKNININWCSCLVF